MTASLRAQLTTGVALLAASAVAVAPSLAPPPLAMPTATHSIELTAGVEPLLPLPKPDVFPTLFQEVQHGILPSLGVALPTPDIPAPAPTATNINQAIKNIYNAAEPWVRYGFELATYAAGWVPYVGWLAPQIIIFYNFGERIVRSITFNLDDWIFGPLPFGQGLGNVARDSWNALVQLGIDELHFWLPPLPPLPLASTVTKAAQDVSGVIPGKMRSSIAAAPTRKPTPTPVRTTWPESRVPLTTLQGGLPRQSPHLPAPMSPIRSVSYRRVTAKVPQLISLRTALVRRGPGAAGEATMLLPRRRDSGDRHHLHCAPSVCLSIDADGHPKIVRLAVN